MRWAQEYLCLVLKAAGLLLIRIQHPEGEWLVKFM
jgi:hypothetical protein